MLLTEPAIHVHRGIRATLALASGKSVRRVALSSGAAPSPEAESPAARPRDGALETWSTRPDSMRARWRGSRAVRDYLIEIVLGLASSDLGTCTVSTPSSKDAFTRSPTAFAGSVKDRLNEP